MRRRRISFTTRLFIVLFLLSAVPTVALLGLATWGLRNYVELAGGAGAWKRVGETGKELLNTVGTADADSSIQTAAARHENELSRSLRLAGRWDLVASRLAKALPWIAIVIGILLAGVALYTARRLAQGLSRPVGEVVDWASRLSREEPLPMRRPGEHHEPREFMILKEAFRGMAERLAEGRRQALETERLRGLTEMARRVAHEIKNPLTPLMLALRQARHFADLGRAADLAGPLDVISEEAGRLDEMARSFAQLGRLPEGPTSTIDLEEMLRELMASDLPESVAGNLAVETPNPQVVGHLEALKRAFRNLLGNAVEAIGDRPGGRVDVTIARRNGEVEVVIQDNGPGVPLKDHDRVWAPDFTTKRRGTGLGLAIVRQTVRAHGGEVELRASEVGACFVVRLPPTPVTGSVS